MKTVIAAATYVNEEVVIFEKEDNTWYETPLKEVLQYKNCYYLMIGMKGCDYWCFLPDLEGRDFYINGTRCTVEKLPDYIGDRFVVVEV